MNTPLISAARVSSIALAVLLGGTLAVEAADNNNSDAGIYCHNRAVNDYYDNVASCERNLSDIPDQLALCKSDARADLARADEACGYKSASLSTGLGTFNIGVAPTTVLGDDDDNGKGKGVRMPLAGRTLVLR